MKNKTIEIKPLDIVYDIVTLEIQYLNVDIRSNNKGNLIVRVYNKDYDSSGEFHFMSSGFSLLNPLIVFECERIVKIEDNGGKIHHVPKNSILSYTVVSKKSYKCRQTDTILNEKSFWWGIKSQRLLDRQIDAFDDNGVVIKSWKRNFE